MIPDENVHHRRSVRLPAFNYAASGAYFVTIVTHARAHLFGEIVGEDMHLSPIGRLAEQCWQEIPSHFPATQLATFIIMPNHIHGILILHNRAAKPPVGARHGVPLRSPAIVTLEQFGKPVAGSLATMIRQYKSSVTRLILRRFSTPRHVWQRNYGACPAQRGTRHP